MTDIHFIMVRTAAGAAALVNCDAITTIVPENVGGAIGCQGSRIRTRDGQALQVRDTVGSLTERMLGKEKT